MQRKFLAIAAFPALLAATYFGMWWGGAFSAEFSATVTDEASHYINALALRDYLLTGLGHSPIAFVRNFYLHYPKFAIGHWPPLYYAVLGLWMAVTSTGTVWALLPSAACVAGLAWLAGRDAAARYGLWAGILIALWLILLPAMRENAQLIMLDLPVAVLCLGAALVYERYIETGAWKYALWFGLLASAALLTKGNGACLALLPVFAIPLARRWDLVRRGAFWLPVPVVAVLALPWTLATWKMTSNGFGYHWGLDYTLTALRSFGGTLLHQVTPPLGILFLLGVAVLLRPAGRPVMVALVAAGLVFQCLVPAGLDPRYLLPLFAPIGLVALSGVVSVWPTLERVRRVNRWVWLLAFGVFIGLPVGAEVITPITKPALGMGVAARDILASAPANPMILVASDVDGEGALIASVAMADPALRYFVVRGFKLLGKAGWGGGDYTQVFHSDTEMIAGLDDLGIGIVVVDTSADSLQWPHNQQMLDAIAAFPERWLQIGETVGAHHILTYRLLGNEQRAPDLGKLNAVYFDQPGSPAQ